MKTIILCWVGLLIANVDSFAQHKIVWGAQARLGTSTYEPVELGNRRQSLFTYGAGIYADVALSPHWSFRPQLGWLRKGFEQTTNQYSNSGQLIKVINSKFSYDYLPLDVTLVYRFRADKLIKPFVQLGARGSVLVDNRVSRDTTSQLIAGTIDLEAYKRLTVGGLLVIGVEWKRFSFSVEANHDLSSYLNLDLLHLTGDGF